MLIMSIPKYTSLKDKDEDAKEVKGIDDLKHLFE
jgi:hypothetical protein